MKRIAAISGLLLVLLGACAKKDPQPPAVAPASALRLQIFLQNGTQYEAGTAYVARSSEAAPPLLITAVHLFGPAAGLKEQMLGEDLDRSILAINALPFGSTELVAVGRRARLKSGHPSQRDYTVDDLVGFEVDPGAKANVLRLAEGNPEEGDAVWLVGDQYREGPESQRLWPARVEKAGVLGLTISCLEKIDLRGFSGAPLLDQKGQVVGHLVGIGGPGIGFATGVKDIRRHLLDAGVR